MTGQWVVVRDIPPGGRWQVVSAIAFPTRERGQDHLEFVRASVRAGLRREYRLALLVDPDAEPVDPPLPFDWSRTP